MPTARRKPLPKEVQVHVDRLIDAVQRTVGGEDAGIEPFEAVDSAIRAAASVSSPPEQPGGWDTFSSEFREIIAERVREARLRAGWTQEALASAMTGLGHRWSRVAVAEAESGARK